MMEKEKKHLRAQISLLSVKPNLLEKKWFALNATKLTKENYQSLYAAGVWNNAYMYLLFSLK